MKFIIEFLNNNANALLVIITIIGWVIVFLLDKRKSKYEVKLDLNIKAFKEFIDADMAFTDKSTSLSAKVHPPVILVQCAFINPLHSQAQKELEASSRWLKYTSELLQLKSAYFGTCSTYLRNFETWEALIPHLIKAKNCLFEELEKLIKKIDDYFSYLQSLDGAKSQSWDRNKMEQEGREMSAKISEYMILVTDMNKLLSDHFIGKIYNYKTKKRKTLSPKYKVLTKEGLGLSLETDPKVYEKFNFPMPENIKRKSFLNRLKRKTIEVNSTHASQ